MLFLAIILLITSLVIAGVAAYFSIIGLSLLFVGSGIAIIIMGSALEIGKLVAVTALHHLWYRLNGLLKTYLFIAVLALSLITSIGIYGFLGNGYNATSIKVESLKQNITLNEKKIKTLSEDNFKLENYKFEPSITTVDNKNDNQSAVLQQQTTSIQQRENRILNLRKSIETLRLKSSEEKQQAKSLLDGEITKELSQITLYNNRLQILDKEVQTWLDQGTGGLFKQNGLEKARLVKESQQKERDTIDSQIKNSQSNIDKLRKEYTTAINNIDLNLSEQIRSVEQSISKVEKEINDIQNEITNNKKIFDDSVNKNLDIKKDEKSKQEEIIKQNKSTINSNLSQIEMLIEQNKMLALKINETDVGTFKFFAKNFNLELDKTVNWFIILIILVFDPLAVTLLLCFNHIIGKYKARKEEEVVLPPPPTKQQEQPTIKTEQIIETPVTKEEQKLEFGIDDGNNEYPYLHEEGEKANNQTGLAYKAYPKPTK